MVFPPRYADYESQLKQSWNMLTQPEQKKMFLLGVLVAATTLDNHDMLNVWIPKCTGSLDLEALEEAILQTHLFAGFPKTIEALKQLRRHFPKRPSSKEIENRQLSGEKTSQIVYGKYQARLKNIMDELHPDLTRWMIEDGYGRTLSRSGLTLQDREIAVLASLMSSGMINQYRAHVRGALYAGIPMVDIIWFTNTFQCIIAADLRADFIRVRQEILNRG